MFNYAILKFLLVATSFVAVANGLLGLGYRRDALDGRLIIFGEEVEGAVRLLYDDGQNFSSYKKYEFPEAKIYKISVLIQKINEGAKVDLNIREVGVNKEYVDMIVTTEDSTELKYRIEMFGLPAKPDTFVPVGPTYIEEYHIEIDTDNPLYNTYNVCHWHPEIGPPREPTPQESAEDASAYRVFGKEVAGAYQIDEFLETRYVSRYYNDIYDAYPLNKHAYVNENITQIKIFIDYCDKGATYDVHIEKGGVDERYVVVQSSAQNTTILKYRVKVFGIWSKVENCHYLPKISDPEFDKTVYITKAIEVS